MLVKQGRIPKVDLIKSAHHGSKTSTGAVLLDAAEPAFDIISAGAYNRFGMPHRSVLKKLFERRIRVLRTDKKGAILFRTDGRLIEISPALPQN
jgi:competence protein ComEC